MTKDNNVVSWDPNQVAYLIRCFLRAQGRNRVRQRLEVNVNADLITLQGAQKLYREVFGGELVGVKMKKPLMKRLFGE